MEETADPKPYHHYLYFEVGNGYYQQPEKEQKAAKDDFKKLLAGESTLLIETYATLGFRPGTTFMLWCRSAKLEGVQEWLPQLFRTKLGAWLELKHIYFGTVRVSQYSGRTGKPDQVMQNFAERLPYLVMYPFAKTQEWYMLDFESRRSLMGQHIKIGVGHPDIKQCLLYSYGLDDHEFVVSYEMKSTEEFQDLVKELRSTLVRNYTLRDTPVFTCVHKSLDQLMEWL
jgi:chlorite dismutase